MKKFSTQLNKGFTLVELLVSLALFTIIVVAAIGSLYTVNAASQRVTAMRAVLDNLNFATESMSRTIRTADQISCGGVDHRSDGPNCAFGTTTGSSALSMVSTIDGSGIEYRAVNNGIQKCILTSSGALDTSQCVAITDPKITIKKFAFYVNGSGNDSVQPSVAIMMQGSAKAGPNDTQPFAVQTYISQRTGE